ncbi:hypothetical protein VTK73DRAFT_9187 [Phialemonium thermophilum]|uniref:Uncharacterized protein n=1 Tax=Phialemonium thermophilum TaxID=223376 RepID=A0ABR3W3W8_9PEZI
MTLESSRQDQTYTYIQASSKGRGFSRPKGSSQPLARHAKLIAPPCGERLRIVSTISDDFFEALWRHYRLLPEVHSHYFHWA